MSSPTDSLLAEIHRGPTLDAILRERVGLSDEALTRARLVESETGESFDKIVTRLGLVSEDTLAAALGTDLKLPVAAAADFPAEAVDIPAISVAFLRDRRALPLRVEGDVLVLAMANPLDSDAASGIAFASGRRVARVVARGGDLDSAIDRLYRVEQAGELDDTVDEGDLERLKDQPTTA